MSSSCTPTPTLTDFTTTTTTSLSTSFTTTITVLPDETVTIPFTTCEEVFLNSLSPMEPSMTCTTVESKEVVTVIPGSTLTQQVTFVLTNNVTQVNAISTHYAPCPSLPAVDKANTTPISNPDTTSSSPPSSPSDTSTLSPSSPRSSGAPTRTVTSTSIFYTNAPEPSSLQPGGSSSSNDRVSTNVIVGGVLGGMFGLMAFIALLWFIRRTRHPWDNMFDKDGKFAGRRRRALLEDDDSFVAEPKSPRISVVVPSINTSYRYSQFIGTSPLLDGRSKSGELTTPSPMHEVFFAQAETIPPVPELRYNNISSNDSSPPPARPAIYRHRSLLNPPPPALETAFFNSSSTASLIPSLYPYPRPQLPVLQVQNRVSLERDDSSFETHHYHDGDNDEPDLVMSSRQIGRDDL